MQKTRYFTAGSDLAFSRDDPFDARQRNGTNGPDERISAPLFLEQERAPRRDVLEPSGRGRTARAVDQRHAPAQPATRLGFGDHGHRRAPKRDTRMRIVSLDIGRQSYRASSTGSVRWRTILIRYAQYRALTPSRYFDASA